MAIATVCPYEERFLRTSSAWAVTKEQQAPGHNHVQGPMQTQQETKYRGRKQTPMNVVYRAMVC